MGCQRTTNHDVRPSGKCKPRRIPMSGWAEENCPSPTPRQGSHGEGFLIMTLQPRSQSPASLLLPSTLSGASSGTIIALTVRRAVQPAPSHDNSTRLQNRLTSSSLSDHFQLCVVQLVKCNTACLSACSPQTVLFSLRNAFAHPLFRLCFSPPPCWERGGPRPIVQQQTGNAIRHQHRWGEGKMLGKNAVQVPVPRICGDLPMPHAIPSSKGFWRVFWNLGSAALTCCLVVCVGSAGEGCVGSSMMP
ncbi:hypothetical protein QBC34DRAFT_412874 [Podospora aff. communis PSN243]|uniref:Uncharacterized protein n=1 Tax=Podospora aff. communis PSN243 TaxID=3040156 RepID=A0AAV9GCN7_9PEZI|nr:hypothetical protein QBC34DRAFT_412874 [Podospora aff. communis PSN243]